MNKTVTLNVDGQAQKVRSFGSTVGDVLEAKGIQVTGEDKVSPKPSASLSNGQEIDVRFARPLMLTVDGKSQEHKAYASTVKQALKKFDVKPQSDAFMSAKPSSKIPRTGMHLVVSNPKTVKIKVDGKTKKVKTTEPTVGKVLDTANVKLAPTDEVKPGRKAYVKPKTELKVVRIDAKTKTKDVEVKMPVEVKKDDSMLKGEKKIVKKGKVGKKREMVTVVKANGKVRDRIVLASAVISDPVKQIVKQGTKEAPKPSPSASPSPSPSASSSDNAPSVSSGSVWDKIAQCESGGNWHINTGNGYYGGLQFSAATWHSVGGSGLPSDHSRAEQIKRAEILQKRSGWGQWGCAHARFN